MLVVLKLGRHLHLPPSQGAGGPDEVRIRQLVRVNDNSPVVVDHLATLVITAVRILTLDLQAPHRLYLDTILL